jgi:TatD DNase family protein
MKLRLIDSHAHAQFSDYDEDRDEVIERALNAGVWMINAGANLASSEKAIELAEKYDKGVYATIGVHPSEKSDDFNLDKMRSLAASSKCVAIGECGLENPFHQGSIEEENLSNNKKEQAELFVRHIDFSRETNKPLVIHCRDAYQEIYEIIADNKDKLVSGRPALMHFFSGTVEMAEKFLDFGFVFSFGGATTFPQRSNKTDFISLIKKLPLKAILLETDCPYVTPVPLRGKRNEPLYVTYIAEKIAEIRGINAEKLAESTTENALNFFAIEGPNR